MEDHIEKLRQCKRCLTYEIAGMEKTYASMREYIENLEPDVKVSDLLYGERLSLCKECEMLLEGMCRSCGCYVEMRAAVKKNSCPRKKWASVIGNGD